MPRWSRCANTVRNRSAEAVAPALEFADGAAIDEDARRDRSRPACAFFTLWPTSMRNISRRRAMRRCLAKFSAKPISRVLCAAWSKRRRRHWPAAPAGSPRSTRCAMSFIAARSRRRSTSSAAPTNGLLRYDDMAAFHLTPEEPVSTDFHGMRVYKPGFWSQGPAMIEALNILSGYRSRCRCSRIRPLYIHTLVEALKLAYADRDTYYGDPKFVKMPSDDAALDEVRRGAAHADRPKRLARISARQDRWQSRAASFESGNCAGTKIDDILMAHDTTCVDAIDKDGMMFSATPSGAWLPSRDCGRYRNSADGASAELSAGARAIRTNWRAASGRA